MENDKLKKFIKTTIIEFLNENICNKGLYHGSNTPNLLTLKPQTNKYHSIPPSIFLTTKKVLLKIMVHIFIKLKLTVII